MALGIRKLIVLCLVGLVFLVANIVIVAQWLSEKGVVDFARVLRRDFLTGTAITIIVVLLILLVAPGKAHIFGRRCPVCDRRVGSDKYCPECGSRV